MSHMVIYRGVDGKPGYHQTDDIHDAVGFVEQMRNEEGVEHTRIFRLEEVVFEYRPYYRVELTNGADASAALNSNAAAELTENASAQVGAGDDVPDAEIAADADPTEVELTDVVVDEEAAAMEGTPENGEKAEVGGSKKGLFGR